MDPTHHTGWFPRSKEAEGSIQLSIEPFGHRFTTQERYPKDKSASIRGRNEWGIWGQGQDGIWEVKVCFPSEITQKQRYTYPYYITGVVVEDMVDQR
jgi:hypothetical protein